jgi:hypothetical protein
MKDTAARRAIVATIPVAAIACAAAALAAAAWADRPLMRLIWLVIPLFASGIASHVAQRLRRGEANLWMFIAVGWTIGTLAASTALIAGWGIAKLAGSSTALTLLLAAALALVGGALVNLALKTLASLLSAIRGPSRSPPAAG